MTSHSHDRFDSPVIGIDVGGTKSLAVLHLGGADVLRSERPTPSGSVQLLDTIVDLTMEVEDSARRLGLLHQTSWDVGVGLPGLVTRSGVLRAAPNLIDVVELDAKRILEDRLQRRVWVDNDATCAAVAEWREGAGAGCDDFLLVTIGTGIGAGIVANSKLLRGTNGFAGELGHMFVDPAGPACPCGRRGCWERYASGSGLALLARRAAETGDGDDIVRHAGSIEKIRGEDVADLASRGNSQALGVLDEFGRWIAVGLSNMVNVLDPERIVLGGGAARMGDLLVQPVRSWLERVLYASDHRPTPDVVIARFGETAGAIGAGMLPFAH
ncbi:MAG: ROK family protein [Actinomycetota bacterium]